MHVTMPQASHTPFIEPALEPVMKKFPEQNNKAGMMVVGMFLVVVLLGIGTGYTFAKRGANSASNNAGTGVTTSNSVASETEAGINDEKAFPDTAEGVIKEGGISGEGTHRLERGLGANKDVSLSSTVINLQNFVDKKVEVRGQTISGKSGWLMDVGKVKVIQ